MFFMNGYFLCGVLMIFYYAVLVMGLKQCDPGFENLRREKNIFVGLSLAIVAAAAWQVFSESFIYYWDYGSYWYRAIWGIKSGYLNMKAS